MHGERQLEAVLAQEREELGLDGGAERGLLDVGGLLAQYVELLLEVGRRVEGRHGPVAAPRQWESQQATTTASAPHKTPPLPNSSDTSRLGSATHIWYVISPAGLSACVAGCCTPNA